MQLEIQRVLREAVEAEREECAKLCDQIGDEALDDYEAGGAYECSEAIRARGEKR